MVALFDGVTGLLNEAFGEEITHFDRAGGARSVVSVFRKTPVKVTDDQGGAFLLVSPWWRVSQDALPERPREGDEIAAPTATATGSSTSGRMARRPRMRI